MTKIFCGQPLIKLVALLIMVTALPAHTGVVFAQSAALKGRVTSGKEALPAATVSLLGGDSVFIKGTSADTAGFYQLEQIKPGRYLLKISFIGYGDYYRKAVLQADETKDIGTIRLTPSATELDVVEVVAAPDPVVVREDTVEYNAKSFLTAPNARLQELLKRLPGVSVRSDGTITVNGEVVNEITVNGNTFFGGDAGAALEHLPADVIEKVQVLDTKTLEEQFSGLNSGTNGKSINVTIDDQNAKLTFGKLQAGGANEGLYSADGNLHQFKNQNQLSLIGNSNNISSAGPGDGPGEGNPVGENGIISTHSGGINLRREAGKRTAINMTYQPRLSGVTLNENLTRENFIPAGNTNLWEETKSTSRAISHPATLGVEYKSKHSNLRITSGYSPTTTRYKADVYRATTGESEALINESTRHLSSTYRSDVVNAGLFFGHRFRQKGRSVMGTLNLAGNDADEAGFSEADLYFHPQTTRREIQSRNTKSGGTSIHSRLSFTERIGKRKHLKLSYEINHRKSFSNVIVRDEISNKRDPSQTNSFTSHFTTQRYDLTYNQVVNKATLSTGLLWQDALLSGSYRGDVNAISRRYQYFLPHLRVNWRAGREVTVSMDYNTRVREPSIQQLQPVQSRFNPLNIQTGNLALDPEYNHSARFNIRKSSRKKEIFMMGSVSWDYTLNAIVPSIAYDENQVAETRFVNGGQNRRINVFLTTGFPVRRINSDVSIEPFFSNDKRINIINEQEGEVFVNDLGGTVGYTYHFPEEVDLRIEGFASRTTYTFSQGRTGEENFLNTAVDISTRIRFLKALFLWSSFSSNWQNNNLGPARRLDLLNLSLSGRFLKNGSGELRVSANNILDNRSGIAQVVTQSYIERRSGNIIGAYFMLSFSYHFKATRN